MNSDRPRALALAALLAALAGLAAAQEEPYRVGVPLPLTGKHAKFGEMERRSYLMAIEAINAAGGVRGRPIELDIQDTAGDPSKARSIAERFVTVEGYPILVGGYSSECTLAIARIAEKHAVPYLVVTGASDAITRSGFGHVYRLNPPASLYNLGLSSFLAEVVEPRTVAVLYEATNFGTSAAQAMIDESGRLGIEVVLEESYDTSTLDFGPILSKVAAAGPDVVYIVAYAEEARRILTAARGRGLRPKLFAGAAAGFTLPDFLEAGPAAEFVVSGTLWTHALPPGDYPGAAEYFEAFHERHGDWPDYHGAEAYAAAQVLADVLGRADRFEPGPLEAALAATDTKTVFGPVRFIDFDGFERQNRVPTYVIQVIDGRFETIWPPEVATSRYVYPIDWEALEEEATVSRSAVLQAIVPLGLAVLLGAAVLRIRLRRGR